MTDSYAPNNTLTDVILTTNDQGFAEVTYLTGDMPLQDVLDTHFDGVDTSVVDQTTLPFDDYGVFYGAWQRTGDGSSITVDLTEAKRLTVETFKGLAREKYRQVVDLEFFDSPVPFASNTIKASMLSAISDANSAADVDALKVIYDNFVSTYSLD